MQVDTVVRGSKIEMRCERQSDRQKSKERRGKARNPKDGEINKEGEKVRNKARITEQEDNEWWKERRIMTSERRQKTRCIEGELAKLGE